MKQNEIKYSEVRNKTIVKSNDLIQKSRFSLSLQQQKIILYLISQITPQDDDFKLYEFSMLEFCKVCGLSVSGRTYSELKHLIKEVADKSLWVIIDDKGTETLLRWIEKPYLNENDGYIRIRLDRDMKPYLLQLKENFTQYELIYTLRMRSKYSIRLYELVKSIHYDELKEYKRKYSIDELKKLLDSNYDNFRDLHRRVIKPAIEEINKHTDKNISYELIKHGRTTAEIEFTISSKNPIERIKIVNDIEKEFEKDQITLWDRIEGIPNE